MSARCIFIHPLFYKRVPCLNLSVKADSDKALFSSLTIPHFFHQYKLFCMVKMDRSIPYFTLYYFRQNILDPIIDSICLVPGNVLSTIGTVHIPETSPVCVSTPYCPFQKRETWLVLLRLPPICVSTPYCPFLNRETWLVFQVLFSHMYPTASIDSENFQD